ncbi:MAG: serine/threonine-protein kinase, partial [Acidobacteriota bacterium]|nr:serine/threonine-protein kinase [Acidobacteriota bacterium]
MSPENVAPEEHPIGRMVSNYRLEALVGVGGMGQVYRAWDERLGRTVAVKALRDYLSQDNVARQRFVREARLASRIVHPYVATVFDVVEEDRDVYLVMEYVEGRSLKRVLSRRTLSVQETSRYGREIAEALNTIHAAGLVHRDLKPANVMITNENHIKVMDFGVAREYRPADPDDSSETSITRSGHIAGTPAYMSPEQLRGKKVDNRSDLFSLGIILYESVTGQHPFMRDTYAESLAAIINESPGGASEPESLSQSTPIRAAVLRLLEKDPAKRFQSAEELIPLLDLAGSVDQARPARVPIQQRSWFIPIALGLIVSIAGILYWSFRSDSVPSAPLHSRQLVAVLPIEDHTHAGDTAFSGEMLAALLAVDLGESKIARSLGHDRVVEIVSGIPRGSPRNAQIAAIRRFADVDWVVAASVFSQDTAYEAAVDVYRAGSSSPHASFRVGAARASGLIDLASVRVLKAIDPRSTVEQDAPEPSSRDDEALALEYAARRAVNEYRFSEAIDLLERALSIDPQFIAAQVRLAAALELAGYGERARSAADRGLRMIDDPLRKVSPRLELEGRAVRASLYNDLKAEVELRRELAEMYPDEPGVLATLAAALAQDAQLDEALAFIERALAIEEDDPWLYNLRASVLQRLERYQEAIDSANRAARLFGEMNSAGGIARSIEQRGRAKWGLGDFAGAAGDFAEAAASFERAGLEVPAARAKNKHGDIALAKGELGAARAIYEGTLPVFRRAGNFSQVVEALSGMGTNYLGTGEPQEAESFLREAVEVADELDNPAILIKPLANLASLLV